MGVSCTSLFCNVLPRIKLQDQEIYSPTVRVGLPTKRCYREYACKLSNPHHMQAKWERRKKVGDAQHVSVMIVYIKVYATNRNKSTVV